MDIKYVLVADFEKICRICMKFDKTLLPINSFKIIDMIVACASVQIWKNDDLPNQICNSCFLQLQNIINFKQLCEKSDNEFRQIIEQNQINLWNNQNDSDNVKNEDVDSKDCTIRIKEESIFDNFTNKNILENLKTTIVYDEDDLKKKQAFRPELNSIQTRRKTIQYEFEEESGDEDRGSVWESEDEKTHVVDYKCEKCSKIFKKVDALGLHMQRKHNTEGVKCRKCSVKCYHPFHLRAHEKLHNKCRICNLSFSTSQKLTQHKLTHDNKHIPKITCTMCPTKLGKNSLYKHMRLIHNIETIKKCLKCDTCDETFKTKRILAKHIRKMHTKATNKYKDQIVYCEICGKSLTRGTLRYHMTTHGEREKITCEYCAKIFISQKTLKKHVKVFHKNSGTIYLCSECGLKLQSNYDLNKHLLTHTKERPYACDKCNKKYRRLFHLKVHISRAHLNERNFVCTFCSQAFFDKQILLKHVRRHTGEKPFKCHMCEKTFIQKVHMNVHMKVHTNSM